MGDIRKSALLSVIVTIAASVAVWQVSFCGQAWAQGAVGNNAVYPASGTCCVGSSAFIDAKMFLGVPNGNDFCDTINGILGSRFGNTYPPSGTVIDARGISGSALTCAASPWVGLTNPPPSTILLPAGTITIKSKWVLPGGTMLIGVGTTTTSNSNGLELTTIQACKTGITGCTTDFPSNTPMLQFGSSAGVKGISVEQLTLNGNNLAINGIENANSQDETYVDHVSLFQILGTGLYIHGAAKNSGPYTNITFDTNAATAPSATFVNLNFINGVSLVVLTCG